MLLLPNLPASYQASSFIVVDDDRDVLESLVLSFHDDQYLCQGFLKPSEAKKYLKKQGIAKNSTSDQCQMGDGTDAQQFELKISFDFYKQLFNPKRFQTPRVIITDHDMLPEQTGIELARTLKAQYAIKVILLTGVAALSTAVEAFNHQDIDRFVLKSDANHPQQLRQYVTELQWLACAEADREIARALNHSGEHPLCDSDFIQIFQQLCQEKKIVEFYLLNDSGSFVLLNAEGQQSLLVVNTVTDFNSFLSFAEDEMDTVSPELFQQLQNRSHVVWVSPEQGYVPLVKNWQWFESRQIPNKPIWYAWVDQGLPKKLLKRRISSYQDCIDQK